MLAAGVAVFSASQRVRHTERLHVHFSLSYIGEGSGNPLQCSCLENPGDGGAWWAAVCGVTQSQTRLKQLNSSSSSDLLSIVLRCNGFAGIQKAVVDQRGSRPPDSGHELFLVQVWLWEVLWSFFSVQPLSWSSLVAYKVHFLSQSNREIVHCCYME